jgi:hypothetical protein
MDDLPAGVLAAERQCDGAAAVLGAQLKLTLVIPGCAFGRQLPT